MPDYKVVDSEKLDSDLSEVADSIKKKAGVSEKLDFPDGFKSTVDGIKPKLTQAYITSPKIKLYATDGGYDGFNPVEVNVPPYGEGEIEITENGVHDVSGKATANVNVDTTQAYEEGRQAEQDAFWETYQNGGKRTDYTQAFYKFWDDTNYNPKYPIVVQSGNSLFNQSKVSDTKVDIELMDGAPNTGTLFYYCRQLVTIRKLIVYETNGFSSGFTNCTSLVNITFDGVIGGNISFKDSSLLSAESVQNIIDHLKDLTGLEAKTLTFHANVGAALTEEQKAAITAKNWTLVY